MRFVEIFDDSQRLREDFTPVELESRHPHLRIDRAKRRLALLTAVFGEVDRYHLIGHVLEIECNAHAVSSGRAEIRIKFHETDLGTDNDRYQFSGCWRGWRVSLVRNALINFFFETHD